MAGARIRTIKPEWSEDEMLASLPDSDRVLSVVLIILADDYGNGRANTMYLASQSWPYSRDPLESLAKATEGLRRLADGGFISVYEVSGQSYYSIRNWSKHQKVSHPGSPRVPGQNKADLPASEALVKSSGGSREILVPDLDLDLSEGSGPVASVREVSPARPEPLTSAQRFERSMQPAAKSTTHVTAEDVANAFQEARKATGRGKFVWKYYDNEKLDGVAAEANECGTDRESRLSSLRNAMTAYLESEQKERTYPLAFLVGKVDSYLAVWREKNGKIGPTSFSPLEAALVAAEARHDKALKGGAPPEVLNRLDRAMDSARRALLDSKRKADA